MYKKSKRAVSKLLVLLILLTTVLGNVSSTVVLASDTTSSRKIDVWDFGGVQTEGALYSNNITAGILNDATTLKIGSVHTTAFGDLIIANPNANDKMWYNNADGTAGTNSGGTTSNWGKSIYQYSSDYSANGTYMCNGTGGIGRRYFTIDNVQAGDKISIYGALSSGTSETLHFVHGAVSVSGTTVSVVPSTTQVQDSTNTITSTPSKIDFIAQYSGSYQIYATAANSGKPYYHRVLRTPSVKVNVTLTNSSNIGTAALSFTNDTTGKIDATLNTDGTYSAVLPADYTYTASIDTTDYAITDTQKMISVASSEIPTGKSLTLDVIGQATSSFSGSISGFTDDSNNKASNLKITLKPTTDTLSSSVVASIDAINMTFSANIKNNMDYTVVLSGVNDYELTSGGSANISTNTTQNITVAKKAVYTASGSFVTLPSDVSVSSIKFTNVSDSYVYTGTVTGGGTGAGGGYTVDIRDGAYEITASCSDNTYTTVGHVTVSGSNTTKDVKFSSSANPSSLTLVKDLYVGDSSKAPNNYATVKNALAAAARMNPSCEADRITIHIAPGTYRAMLYITTPYISLVNSDPTQDVKITWYYGIGYKYYSVNAKGFYNEDLAFDKYSQRNVAKWGATVYLTSEAKGFKAENIIFENSFNKYVTNEELEDGVALSAAAGGSSISVERTKSLDVTSRPATERAAAMAIEADNIEFNKCSFLSSQDTLYTGGAALNQYYKDCFIEGNTDYIYGDGDAVFDNCTLNFAGYSDTANGGHITAATSKTAPYGYLFRDCTVTATSTMQQTAGDFGRPWNQLAKVKFLDTKLQNSSMITAAGWTDMSGASPEKANYYEYNTTSNGVPVDTSTRRGYVLSGEAAVTDVSNYFGSDWTPTYYTAGTITNPPVLQEISTTQSTAVVTWSPSATTIGSVIYAVYKDGEKCGTTTAATYTVEGLAASTKYGFSIFAMNTAGNTTMGSMVYANTKASAPPSAPVLVSATAGSGTATIAWNSVADATYYTLKGRAVSESVYTMVYEIDNPSVTSYTYSGLTNGKTYKFVVTASNASGESANSNEATVMPLASFGIPAVPASVSATAGATTATITWSAVPGATSYTIRGGTSSGTYTMLATVNDASVTSYTYSGLTYGQTYYFTVTASNSFGESSCSAEASVTVGKNTTLKPGDFIGVDVGNPLLAGSSSFNDDTNVFTLTGAGIGVNKNANTLEQFYLMAVKIKGDYTLSAKVNYDNPDTKAEMGLMIRDNLTDNTTITSYQYTEMAMYGTATDKTSRKSWRYIRNGALYSNGSKDVLPVTGTVYISLKKVGNAITAVISTSPIPENPVAKAGELVINSANAEALGLDSSGNAKELYAGMMISSQTAGARVTATFEDVKVVMSDGTVAFDSNEGKPVPPKNVVTKSYDKSALITWNALSTATSYTVYQSTSAQGSFTAVQTVAGSVYEAKIAGLENDKTYYYYVTASNTSGESIPSKIVSVIPDAAALIPPVITMTSAEPASEVFSALLPLSGSVDKASTLTIKNNGNLVKLDGLNTSLSLGKNGSFSNTLILVQGLNDIEIKIADTYGFETIKTYKVTYTYKASNINFCDIDDNIITGLMAGKDIIIKAPVENYIATAKDAVLVVGLYDEQNNLIKFIFTAETLFNGETEVFYAKLKLPDDINGYTLKAYIWDGLTDMHPVSDVVVLK